jgi:hypothetical protein
MSLRWPARSPCRDDRPVTLAIAVRLCMKRAFGGEIAPRNSEPPVPRSHRKRSQTVEALTRSARAIAIEMRRNQQLGGRRSTVAARPMSARAATPAPSANARATTKAGVFAHARTHPLVATCGCSELVRQEPGHRDWSRIGHTTDNVLDVQNPKTIDLAWTSAVRTRRPRGRDQQRGPCPHGRRPIRSGAGTSSAGTRPLVLIPNVRAPDPRPLSAPHKSLQIPATTSGRPDSNRGPHRPELWAKSGGA